VPGPLADVTVIDLTSVISGPFATAVLADQGARVIKIESLTGDTMRFAGSLRGGAASLFCALNRNKEAIALDLHTAEGVAVVKRLAATADVVIQNYRPGVVERLGLDYPAIREVRDDIVYASISGVGPDGPYAARRVYDPVIQSHAGYAAAQGGPGNPDLIRMMVCDKVTALSMSQAITAALYHRLSTGTGQHVEVSMLEAALYFLWPDRMFDESFVGPVDTTGPDIADVYRVMATRDGHLALALVQVDEFHGLFRAIGRAELTEDERFQDVPGLLANVSSIIKEIRAELPKWETSKIAERLLAEDVPFGIVLTGSEVLDDPQVKHLGAIIDIDHPQGGAMRLVERTARFSETPARYRTPAPALGQDTEAVLKSFDFTDREVSALRHAGTITG
jgi:crotonobetainyl-CoA:carnitine CoA-transferase CaiB-like acyl-CoA transferase